MEDLKKIDEKLKKTLDSLDAQKIIGLLNKISKEDSLMIKKNIFKCFFYSRSLELSGLYPENMFLDEMEKKYPLFTKKLQNNPPVLMFIKKIYENVDSDELLLYSSKLVESVLNLSLEKTEDINFALNLNNFFFIILRVSEEGFLKHINIDVLLKLTNVYFDYEKKNKYLKAEELLDYFNDYNYKKNNTIDPVVLHRLILLLENQYSEKNKEKIDLFFKEFQNNIEPKLLNILKSSTNILIDKIEKNQIDKAVVSKYTNNLIRIASILERNGQQNSLVTGYYKTQKEKIYNNLINRDENNIILNLSDLKLYYDINNMFINNFKKYIAPLDILLNNDFTNILCNEIVYQKIEEGSSNKILNMMEIKDVVRFNISFKKVEKNKEDLMNIFEKMLKDLLFTEYTNDNTAFINKFESEIEAFLMKRDIQSNVVKIKVKKF